MKKRKYKISVKCFLYVNAESTDEALRKAKSILENAGVGVESFHVYV